MYAVLYSKLFHTFSPSFLVIKISSSEPFIGFLLRQFIQMQHVYCIKENIICDTL